MTLYIPRVLVLIIHYRGSISIIACFPFPVAATISLREKQNIKLLKMYFLELVILNTYSHGLHYDKYI